MTVDLLWPAVTLVLAVVLDLLVGDPPNRWHPVSGVGTLVGWSRARLARGPAWALVIRGAVLILALALLAGAAGFGISAVAHSTGWAGVILEAVGLKLMISLRGLVVACREVAASLSAGDLTAARRLLGYHLVSRPTGTLDRAHVASATIESASENLTDAFVAPLCFYVVLGLAGAWAYRAINTADAMIGYRDAELEFLGKASARLDDLCNLIPARIAGLAIVVSALLAGGRAGAAWATMVRDHRRPASPNAGWTMAAMAGALGVVLEKAGAYRLGTGKYPDCPDIERGLRIMVGAAVGTTAGLLGLILLRNYSR